MLLVLIMINSFVVFFFLSYFIAKRSVAAVCDYPFHLFNIQL